jgi:hypothetical protein
MTVDLRAVVACDLGNCISGDLSNNHISDRSGLIRTSGQLLIDGIVNPARGTAVSLVVACPQTGLVTLFPKPLRVIRALPNVIERTTTVEVGCKLTLMSEKREDLVYLRPGFTAPPGDAGLAATPIYAQDVLNFCLGKIGVQLAPGSQQLQFRFLRSGIDLSSGYVQMIGELIRSECCYGRMLPNEQLEIKRFNLTRGGSGPVLLQDDLVSVESVTAGAEPADNYKVTYTAAINEDSDDGSPATDWTREETIGPPEEIEISYRGILGIPATFSVTNIPVSISETTYETYEYTDAQGATQKKDVAVLRTESKTAKLVSIAESIIAGALSASPSTDALFILGVGNANIESSSETIYEYRETNEGPELAKETRTEVIPFAQYVGGFGLPNEFWRNYIFNITSGSLVSQRTEVEYEEATIALGRKITKQKTTRWLAYGLSQEGQSAFAVWLETIINDDTGAISRPVEVLSRMFQMQSLRFEGTEVQTSIGRAPAPEKPSDQELVANEIGTEERFITGTVIFDGEEYEDPSETVTATYAMPFAPDDFYVIDGDERIIDSGSATAAAEAFGEVESALDIGHAFGQNIVTEWSKFPTLDLAPIYIRIAGIEAAFLTDSVSYAWDANGMVVSSDLMLVGVTGWYGNTRPASSWVRLPVPTLALEKID